MSTRVPLTDELVLPSRFAPQHMDSLSSELNAQVTSSPALIPPNSKFDDVA